MLKIIYAGTPEFAVPTLEALMASKHEVIAVYTQPDRPAGRGRKLQSSPVKACALANQIPVFQPHCLKESDNVRKLRELGADLMVVAAYGLILPQEILAAPRLGCINIHASLLPRWRGAAPIQRSILAGDKETGITIMQMDRGLDTGNMLSRSVIAINPAWNSGDLHDELKEEGAALLLSTIDEITSATTKPEIQDSTLATYAGKLVKQEAGIDWEKSAEELSREIRAFAPWPISFTQLDGTSVRIWRAIFEDVEASLEEMSPGTVISHTKNGISVCCGTGILRILELQFAGKNRNTAKQLLNANNLTDQVFV